MKILVTGGSGQLGSTLKEMAKEERDLTLVFKSSQELDITDYNAIHEELTASNYAYCINCAAFTGSFLK